MSDITPIEDGLREKLAAIEHERWSDWQNWLHSRLKPHDDPMREEMMMDGEDFERWSRQIQRDYVDLSEEEKNSDREQVDRYWPLVQAYATHTLQTFVSEVLERMPKGASEKG